MTTKLKKKIWFISTIISVVYSGALLLKPFLWTSFLPILIPAVSLTVGIPIYSIHKKRNLEEMDNNQKEVNIPLETKQDKVNDSSTHSYSYSFSTEEDMSPIKDKQKIKTKGTIR